MEGDVDDLGGKTVTSALDGHSEACGHFQQNND